MRLPHGFWWSEISKGLDLLLENQNDTLHSQILFTGSWQLLLSRINLCHRRIVIKPHKDSELRQVDL